jgi:hypothetical protein
MIQISHDGMTNSSLKNSLYSCISVRPLPTSHVQHVLTNQPTNQPKQTKLTKQTATNQTKPTNQTNQTTPQTKPNQPN